MKQKQKKKPPDALELAVRYLGHRDRTVAEIELYLAKKNYDPETINEAVSSLLEQKYLDDEAFTARFIADKRTLDQWGSERITRRLCALGIDRQMIEQQLAAEDSDQELSTALKLLSDRVKMPPSDDRERNRAFALLVRRGYEAELAYDALRAFARQHAQ